jgi:hypothetical protein
MDFESFLRNRLNSVLDEYGMKLSFVAGQLGWKYHHLNRFKNGKASMSRKRERILNDFLDKYDKQTV